MVIDKKLNLDTELEYFPDGSLTFAQNVITSPDGLTIQNEPAIVNFCSIEQVTMVGFIACNNEFVVFCTKLNDNNKSTIYRVKKDSTYKECITNWKWQGGEVFGTFSYNVNDELIIAISERIDNDDNLCPLKIINLDRDKYIEGTDDNIYTLTPDIPKSNLIDIEYVLGNKIKKGKYNFFIKYFVEDNYETAWYPIGFPVFVYDNYAADSSKIIDSENVQAVGELSDRGIPDKVSNYEIKYDDFYNNAEEYVNNNVILKLSIEDVTIYTHYKIGYIVNSGTSLEAYQTSKQYLTTKKILIGEYKETISVDELTANNFNLYNIKTLCNYKDRLYVGNYVEENRNKDLDDIDTSNIKVFYNPSEAAFIPEVVWDNNENKRNFEALKNQWKTKPGRFGIYNFYIHYVYPNGNYTDGIKVGSLSTFKYKLLIGQIVHINPFEQKIVGYEDYYLDLDVNSTTTDILNKYDLIYQEYYPMTDEVFDLGVPEAFQETEKLRQFCEDNANALWHTVVSQWEGMTPKIINSVDSLSEDIEIDNPSNLVELEFYPNSKGDILYKMPFDTPANISKLYFKGIKMYPQFVGYFISYEKPEYIQIGEGFVIPNTKTEKFVDDSNKPIYEYSKDLFDVGSNATNDKWKFYYPEFNIVGGKTNITNLYQTGTIVNVAGNNLINKDAVNGLIFSKNSFNSRDVVYDVNKSEIVSPNVFENINREGYLNITFTEKVNINQTDVIKTYTAVNNNYDIYLSDIKELVSLGFIKYQSFDKNNVNAQYDYGYEKVIYNYDFYRCFSSIIFLRGCGVITNQTDSNPINAYTGFNFYPVDRPGDDENFYPHIGIIKYWHETHYPLFLKELNREPEVVFYSHYKLKELVLEGIGTYLVGQEQYQQKSLVINSSYINDLYKLNAVYYDYTGKVLVNYDDKLVFNKINRYTKTIRRSDVIQSESVVNSWKQFKSENYKVITEDKGVINNIVGIGNYLFAHCEHSLFLFDVTDSLQAVDKNVQLLQPDSFDVGYKEVFTASKGYGGIQDNVSWICDEFGYIFYDKSSKKIYRFDCGQLKDATEGINNLIKELSPEQIWFGNDRTHNRILANIRATDDNLIISYNLITSNWISTHSYTSDYKFIDLKDKLFIPNITNNNLDITHYIDSEFNKFVLPVGNIDNDGSFKSFIDVIFTNPTYNKIKVLDFITYILNKEPADNFELLQIEIYTNCCYSGILNIREERKRVADYKKPYYDYERWNFNYFRNVIDKIENGELIDRLSGRIHTYPQKVQRGYDNALISGKYVVIRFNFKLVSKQVNIKDIHAYFKP